MPHQRHVEPFVAVVSMNTPPQNKDEIFLDRSLPSKYTRIADSANRSLLLKTTSSTKCLSSGHSSLKDFFHKAETRFLLLRSFLE